ncbi:MAG TPA: P-II family nitrogen regulator [Nitrosopumilaceae archaeon]|nr:P-II family nitrogen regulator [Nitrosopumilaceae archaeon]
MIRIEIVLGKNDVMAISEALKKIPVGGITVTKKRGRGKNPPPEIHASKGTEIFQPQFGNKYMMEVLVPDEKEEEVIELVKKNAKIGKIFITPVSRAIDIATGKEGNEAI